MCWDYKIQWPRQSPIICIKPQIFNTLKSDGPSAVVKSLIKYYVKDDFTNESRIKKKTKIDGIFFINNPFGLFPYNMNFLIFVLRCKDLPLVTLYNFTSRILIHYPCLVDDFEYIAAMSLCRDVTNIRNLRGRSSDFSTDHCFNNCSI